jgi:hypothetical protein
MYYLKLLIYKEISEEIIYDTIDMNNKLYHEKHVYHHDNIYEHNLTKTYKLLIDESRISKGFLTQGNDFFMRTPSCFQLNRTDR